jgi:hypothetical protein
MVMTFDEFIDKLNKIKFEYERLYQRKLSTVDELELYLMKKAHGKNSKGLKSLKSLPSFNR